MAIEASLSKHKRTNVIIYIVVCLVLGGWCGYDGYFNEKWIEEHTDADGNPETYLVVNRKAPPYFAGAAVLLGIYLAAIRNRKVTADEEALVINNKEAISYDSIEKIDKTHFKSKGFFIITYKDKAGGEVNRKISDRTYDNLAPVLDKVVAKIS